MALLTPVGTCPFDVDQDGDIDEDDSIAVYRFIINNPVISGAWCSRVPAPGALALLVGGVAIARRRRRR